MTRRRRVRDRKRRNRARHLPPEHRTMRFMLERRLRRNPYDLLANMALAWAALEPNPILTALPWQMDASDAHTYMPLAFLPR